MMMMDKTREKVEVNVLVIHDNFLTGIIINFWNKYLRITVNSLET